MIFFEKSQLRGVSLFLSICLLTTAVFVSDLMIPIDVGVGIPYAIVVFLSGWLPWRRALPSAVLVTTILTIVGYSLSETPDEAWKVAMRCGFSLLAIWGAAFLLHQRAKVEAKLKAADEKFERIVLDRDTRLTSILDYIPEGVIVVDEQGNIDTVNRGTELLFGYTAEELRNRNVSCLMPEPYRSAHNGYIARYVKTGEGRIIDTGPREVEAITKAGVKFPLELSIGLMDIPGELKFIGVARDVTDRKHAEKQLQHSQKIQAIGQLTSGIAHDFNNLLTVIQGNLELLEDYLESDSPLRIYVEAVIKAGARAADLTRHLLAYSRKQILVTEAVDVNELMPGITMLLDRTLGEEISIETVLAGGLWEIVVDKGKLQNALINLAVNARDAMPQGGKLTVETANTRLDREYADTHEEVTPGQYVMIAITDTGKGIPSDMLDKIFDPFFTTKDTGEGTGLGLSMVFGFVKQSGGHIKVYSEVGEGTTVKIYLPRSLTNREKDTSAPPAIRRPAGDEIILIAEDDPHVRSFLINGLEVLGYTVYAEEDGPSALKLMASIPKIDLLITDIVMPHGMNGKQVADAFMNAQPNASVLFISGYTENAIVHHGVLDEDVELLMKPFTTEKLAQTVRTVLDDRILH